jgi:hypothetical protein
MAGSFSEVRLRRADEARIKAATHPGKLLIGGVWYPMVCWCHNPFQWPFCSVICLDRAETKGREPLIQ